MSKLYQVRDEFIGSPDDRNQSSSDEKDAIDDALSALENDPKPSEYGCKHHKGDVYKIWVPPGGSDFEILYELDSGAKVIDVIQIKRTGMIARAKKRLEELGDFTP